MAIQTTSNLSNSVRTRYKDLYIQSAKFVRQYDQFAQPIGKVEADAAAINGSSVQVNFLSDLPPATVAISQTLDITPRQLRDATASITPTSRGDAIQWSETLDIQAYTDYGAGRFRAIGKQQGESVDLLAQAAALQGGVVHRAAARASLDAGTSGHRLSDLSFNQADSRLQTYKCPMYIGDDGYEPTYFAHMHPDAFTDLRLSTNIVAIAQYQQGRIILRNELGQVGRFRILVSPWAKVLGGAGADNASNVDTTLNGAVNELATSIVVASATNVTAGQRMTIGTEETGTTFYADNELVTVDSGYTSGTTVTVQGEGANGGLRFAHASGTSVRNADHVYPVVFGGPMSLAKLYAPQIGEFGATVGPLESGTLRQFRSLGWKYHGGYGRWVETWLVRGEFACSLQA